MAVVMSAHSALINKACDLQDNPKKNVKHGDSVEDLLLSQVCRLSAKEVDKQVRRLISRHPPFPSDSCVILTLLSSDVR